ncbi:adenylate dimethylallyltransferase Tzs [Ralstonia solanacearum]|uniref:adenylate dimethylallyltransferase Tzs n=1 Tax=Ralstonia solanacearum TaxID=305 RepID=UPI00078B2A0C|nr:adenylate dimethylallyltransferase Tzs [Ralstonia solanacearum]AMP40173.1 isopentenyl transferase [Ralstonia solanacearum]AXV89025.1 isopentenyl transferase [Ralstonia solanacearum]AXW08492.1 isopentenyl transferase [Ralstonia solanacearum]AXW26278.1 isopentenyl transferase [Ralstonia solanacearum]AXW64380.1 isopentenyl transferase [Ralstonia solanacearum]
MPVRLYLIWGATTTGKTAQSVALARATGAPVISLDRVQCCDELAVGSGRPSPSDLLGTRREYLCDRAVSSGVISAAEANQLLLDKVARYSVHERALILEGGSVSLINAMIRDVRWSERGEWALRRIALPGPAAFMAGARKRVREMLDPPSGQTGILGELEGLWGHPRNHAVLEDIDGYRQIIRYARASQVPIDRITSIDRNTMALLVERIAQEYWEHALWQEQEFLGIPASWKRADDA